MFKLLDLIYRLLVVLLLTYIAIALNTINIETEYMAGDIQNINTTLNSWEIIE